MSLYHDALIAYLIVMNIMWWTSVIYGKPEGPDTPFDL